MKNYSYALCYSIQRIFWGIFCIWCCGITNAQGATVHIGDVCSVPKINFSVPDIKTKYITNLSPEEFSKKLGQDTCHVSNGYKFCEKGVTILPATTVSFSVLSGIVKRGNFQYVCPREIKVLTQYKSDVIPVYLSNEYSSNSCEFRELKKHEDYHVQVFKQSVPFYQPQIKKSILQELQKMPASFITSRQDIQQITHAYVQQLSKKFLAVNNYINQKMADKNSAIDTLESYLELQKKCKNW